jgi:hypothetical protein
MQLYLGGHLNYYDSQKRHSIEISLRAPTLLSELLNRMNVPLSEIAVGTLNGEPLVAFDHITLVDADSLRLYPPVDGG